MKKQAQGSPMLREACLEIVDNQLRGNDPPETRATYDRLRQEGFTDEDARLLIGSAIAAETYHILKSKEAFNHQRFVRNLNRLPDQNFDDD